MNQAQTQSPAWIEETRELMRTQQSEVINMTVPGLAVVALGILLLQPFNSFPTWGLISGWSLLLGSLLVWVLNRRSFLAAALSLITVVTILILSLILIARIEPALALLCLPAALAMLFFGIYAGTGLALLALLLIAASPSWFAFTDPIILGISSALSVTVPGIVWLTLKPLLTTLQWSWGSYLSSQEALKQARDLQSQLRQSLSDLTGANEQLRRLNKLTQSLRIAAEEERRTKQEFVANVSHELRTPLNMIIGFCGMITSSPETYGDNIPPKLLADLQVVLRNSQHLSSLIDDVLDLSQIDAGRIALSMSRVPVEIMIQAACQAVTPLIQSKNLSLQVDIQPDLPELWCDETRIREVLLNLLSNAARFTEAGGISVSARLEGHNLVFVVRDTGRGISTADQEKLFRPFQQADGTIRRKYGGTGLGLSISKSFVELHDGRMWIESDLGVGTAIYFSLPVDPIPEPPASAARWINPYGIPAEFHQHHPIEQSEIRPRFVVVEQSPVLERLLERFVEHIEIVRASSIASAVREIQTNGAQCLLVNDINTGEVIDELKELHALPFGIPAFTCFLPGPAQARSDLAVANYLVKPVALETFIQAINELPQPIENVLLVDDEPDARQLFRRYLSSYRRDLNVLRAGDGIEALQILAENTVDLIIMDLSMPRMDGFQFLETRETNPALRQIPVILISARDPLGQPLASNALTVMRGGGLSVNQILNSIAVLSQILAPWQPSNDPKPPTDPGG